MIIFSDKIYTPDGIRRGFLEINQGKIKNISEKIGTNEYLDYTGYNIIPGFVDIHIHGWGRGNFGYKGEKDSIKRMAEDLVHTGVTSFLPTSGVMPQEFLEDSLKNAREYLEEAKSGAGAEVVGIHMEGPFINEKYVGMQRLDSIQKPSIEAFEHYNKLSGGNVKLMTLAPEVEGGIELIKHLSKKGISTSAGHTAATFDEMRTAIEAGLTNCTHTYSGMRGFHHREPGVVGAAMYFNEVYAEVAKQTGITIRPEAFDILYRLKTDDRMVMMTDCLGFADFPEGYNFYHYLRKTKFTIEDGNLVQLRDSGEKTVTIPDTYESVRGLEMSFIESVRNVVDRLEDGLLSVARIASENPAKIAGVFDRKGSIEAGKDADLLILDEDNQIIDVFCCGKKQDIIK